MQNTTSQPTAEQIAAANAIRAERNAQRAAVLAAAQQRFAAQGGWNPYTSVD